MTMNEPTSDQCTKHEELPGNPNDYTYADWHPQWGGYASHCIVSFGREAGDVDSGPGCFDVVNFHDGEFPGGVPTVLHYCSAEQVIDFGLTVLEQQLRIQSDGYHKEPVGVPREFLQKVQARVAELLSKTSPRPQYRAACQALGLDMILQKQLRDGEMWRVDLDERIWGKGSRFAYPCGLPRPDDIKALYESALKRGEPKKAWLSLHGGVVIGIVIVNADDVVLAYSTSTP